MGGQRPARGRPVLGAVRAALGELTGAEPGRLWALGEGEVAEAMQLLGRLSGVVDALLVGVAAEAKRRSLGAGDGWGPRDWARSMAPMLPARTLADVDAVAAVADDLRLAGVVDATLQAAAGAPAGTSRAVPVGKAAQLVRFHQSVRGLADPTQLGELTTILLDAARGPAGLAERELATALRHTGDLLRQDHLVEHDADTRRAHRSLVKTRGPVGLSRYTLLLEEEGAAIVDAAVDALAKPAPDPDTGAPDPRTPAARRADALLDLVSRAVSAPEGTPRQAKTTMVVTVDLPTLQGQARRAALTTGGELLTPATARRLACDAQLIPVVLGTRGEVLDQGQATRLFTRPQIRHLWLRDRHCTFPGCTKPAPWTDAHHLIHWADHGPTDIANAALLCRAHHTVVHRDRYAGTLTDGPTGPHVQWDLTPGSYDHHLQALRQTGRIPPRP